MGGRCLGTSYQSKGCARKDAFEGEKGKVPVGEEKN